MKNDRITSDALALALGRKIQRRLRAARQIGYITQEEYELLGAMTRQAMQGIRTMTTALNAGFEKMIPASRVENRLPISADVELGK